jgi:hypothetical protein
LINDFGNMCGIGFGGFNNWRFTDGDYTWGIFPPISGAAVVIGAYQAIVTQGEVSLGTPIVGGGIVS